MTKPLSPAAQTVLNACDQAFNQCGTTAQGLAAALQTAAYLEVSSNFDGMLYETGEDEFRAFLHAIAAELEGQS